jgi:uncharacterized membrane protein
MMNGYDMNGWAWAGMALMALAIVAIVALVVWAIVRRPELRDVPAREQLDARLASGAIDTQEYRKRLDALGR